MGEMWSIRAAENSQLSKMASHRLLLLFRKLAHTCIRSLATCAIQLVRTRDRSPVGNAQHPL